MPDFAFGEAVVELLLRACERWLRRRVSLRLGGVDFGLRGGAGLWKPLHGLQASLGGIEVGAGL